MSGTFRLLLLHEDVCRRRQLESMVCTKVILPSNAKQALLVSSEAAAAQILAAGGEQ